MTNKTVAFVTLGCKLNFSETSTIAQQFLDNGYEKVAQNKPADIYVINTCSVTEHADKKCRQSIRKLHKQNPDAIIAVTGCYAQLKPAEIMEIEGVDLVVGADRKGDVFQLVSELPAKQGTARSYSCAINEVETIFPAFSSGERTRSLKFRTAATTTVHTVQFHLPAVRAVTFQFQYWWRRLKLLLQKVSKR